MQRDRARERNERARRQWELEHADMQQVPPGSGPPGMTPSGSATPRNNGPTMNHIGSSDTIDGIPGFSLVIPFRSDTIVGLKGPFFSKVNENSQERKGSQLTFYFLNNFCQAAGAEILLLLRNHNDVIVGFRE